MRFNYFRQSVFSENEHSTLPLKRKELHNFTNKLSSVENETFIMAIYLL